MTKPPFLIETSELPAEFGRYPAPFDAEPLSEGRDLGRAAGSERLGAWHERLPPGHRTSRTHAHSREEELVYVLRGAPVLRWCAPGQDPVETPLRPGSFLAFPAGTAIAHSIRNPGPEDAELLVMGERNPADSILYPEDPDLEAWRLEHRPSRVWRPAAPGEPWPEQVRTPRLCLSPWRPEEGPVMADIAHRERHRLLPWLPWARAVEDGPTFSRRFLEWRATIDRQTDLFFAIRLPDGRPIGGMGLHARVGPGALEMGYWIVGAEEGRGYITEAAAALTTLALGKMGRDRVEIRHDPANHRSGQVPARLGYTPEGTLRRRMPDGQGDYRDVVVWALYRSELEASPAAKVKFVALDRMGRRI